MADDYLAMPIDLQYKLQAAKVDKQKQPQNQTALETQNTDFKSFLKTAEVKEIPQESEVEAKTQAQAQAQDAIAAFKDYMDKTPEERIREMILREMDLTEEQLAAMPPDERLKIEEKIKEKIEEHIKAKAEQKQSDPEKS